MLFPNERHRSLMLSPLTRPQVRDAAHGLLASDQARVSVLRDSAGLVAQRVVATIVNIACDIAQQGIAAPARHRSRGHARPRLPAAARSPGATRLGAPTVLAVLNNMLALSGDPRYRASPWLRRRARSACRCSRRKPESPIASRSETSHGRQALRLPGTAAVRFLRSGRCGCRRGQPLISRGSIMWWRGQMDCGFW